MTFLGLTPQAWQATSYYVGFAAAILTAGCILVHFLAGRQIKQEENRESDAKISEIIRSQERIERMLTQKSSTLHDDLLKRYSLGFGLLYTDGHEIHYVDKTAGVEVDWSKTKILEMTPEKIDLLLPDWHDPKQNVQIASLGVSVRRVPGRIVNVIGTHAVSVRVEVIENNPDGAFLAIGFQPKETEVGTQD